MTPLTPSKTLKVWLAVGQSNVVGTNADGTQLTTSDLDDRILLWQFAGTKDSETYVSNGWTNFAKMPSGFGPERGFARRWARMGNARNRTGIIKVAHNGLGISHFIPGGGSHATVVAQVDAAIAAAQTQEFAVTVEGMICLGHTADARGGTSQAQYESWLAAQSADYAARWGATESAWKIALADHPASWSLYDATGAPAIRAAIAAFAAANSTRVAVASTAGTADVGDAVHYTSESKELVGRRMADAILTL